HSGGKYRGKSAVGVGAFEATKHRFPDRHALTTRPSGAATARDLSSLPPTPLVGDAEDWPDVGTNFASQTPTPLFETDMLTEALSRPTGQAFRATPFPRTPLEFATPLLTPRLAAAPPQSAPQVARNPARFIPQPVPQTFASTGLGILPLPKTQKPVFGYGLPAVAKDVPPCALVQPAVAVPDIPPEERFRTSYSKQFPAYDVRALFAEDRKAIMPARYVPAGNRQLRDL
ncbi:unnamed protein product, partial [Polarella glacialis]